MRVRGLCLALGVALFGFVEMTRAELLYDVDFGTPPHNPGEPPVVGAGPPPRETPTNINFGDPTVVVAFEDMNDQPCQFGNGTTGYDQLLFSVGSNDPNGFPDDYNDYFFSADLVIGALVNDQFVIHFDAPSINRLDFLANGDVREFASGTIVGSWLPGVTTHIGIHFDTVNATWEIWLDDSFAYLGSVNTDGRLRAIRLHMSGTDAGNGAAIDNFILHGGLPGAIENEEGHQDGSLAGRLLSPHPNPTDSGTTIRWTTTRLLPVDIDIADIGGRLIWTKHLKDLPAGDHQLQWDGLGVDGRPVPSGIYFVHVRYEDRLLGSNRIVMRR